ncbi:hypothetical protein F3Y22_tig00005459pilonHSYRG00055 [Hibiscus syriacus]|uniref:Uncharacterized protein n=1 Tax=Hibiscus syriacus TaxID=106335 RepID=A0A6A3CDL0_HIBSY|nr:hypothetical protein F3Y22_tig00005459pilonHSYRG00055 [Hibiscus syriacus]
MGCEASKLYGKKDRVQAKVMSLLSRKLDAVRRRKSHSSLSKQMLPNPGSEDVSIDDLKSSALLSRVPDDDGVRSAKIAPTVSDNDVREHDSEGDGDNVESHKSRDKEASTMEKATLEEKDHKIVEETERLKKERSASLHCPESPSFRFYLRVQAKVMSLISRKLDALKRRSHSSLSKQMLPNTGSNDGYDRKSSAVLSRVPDEVSASLLCPGSPSFRFYLTDNDGEE